MSGETTLFDLLSGFVPQDSGSIHLANRDISELVQQIGQCFGLGRSFQDARLFPSPTVAEAIAVALERHRSKTPYLLVFTYRILRKRKTVVGQVAELIEVMGLGAYENKFVGELSTGTRRMVDLACVIAHRPLVVLLDEPSSGIAQKEAEQLVLICTASEKTWIISRDHRT